MGSAPDGRSSGTVSSPRGQAGRVTPIIDRRYELSGVPASLRYLEEGHAKGKIVINL
jgi:NADPH:quinone reductase-like Zn-dependent oxidoreductase